MIDLFLYGRETRNVKSVNELIRKDVLADPSTAHNDELNAA